ncbi:RNA polymerase sigma factor [Flavivirga spongiicola]|uniref:Sigma-70 family RNA polymerase sigma factor n=1 Tax=Flavivirga spongiicola TaxID=421621 RepID=A0ABU7XS06_9FLAO|nr:sigma-70 family RNA polymerase sigma factor [Flavivirga sp. MEBiC05379]MDO5978371.1 sigma-70 family RNA polymerase sigma factor [Flavivirga sp. MEBiC05379]
MGDFELINAIEKDDNNAFKLLFNKYYIPLINYIQVHARDKDLSKDVVQQTFIVLWKQRYELNISKSVKGYLHTLAYRIYVDHYRNLKRKNIFLEELKERKLRESIFEDKEKRESHLLKLRTLIDALPPKCKEILQLNKMNGLKYEEIAEQLGISKKTVEAQMRIAFQKIRKGFKDDNLILFVIRSLNGILKLQK